MRSRYFTPEEASAALPRLKDYVIRMRAGARELTELAMILDPIHDDNPDIQDELREKGFHRIDTLRRQMETWMDEVVRLGVEVKDIDEGLVDFPALKQGKEVCLCWRLGESEVAHWHTSHQGFSGRQSILEVAEGDWVWFS